jgi:uncharacterized protein
LSKPVFVVPAADLERGPRQVSWVIPEAWLRAAFAESGATPTGDGQLDVELSKNGAEVMVRGKAHAKVTVPCVVTLDPLPFELEPELFLLLSPAPSANRRSGRGRGDRPGRNGGKGAPAGWSDDPELGSEDVARDTYDGEKVVLDEFLREFVLLELPMYPRRSDLPSSESPAIAPPSPAEPERAPDPRLMPLAAIAARLRDKNNKE